MRANVSTTNSAESYFKKGNNIADVKTIKKAILKASLPILGCRLFHPPRRSLLPIEKTGYISIIFNL